MPSEPEEGIVEGQMDSITLSRISEFRLSWRSSISLSSTTSFRRGRSTSRSWRGYRMRPRRKARNPGGRPGKRANG